MLVSVRVPRVYEQIVAHIERAIFERRLQQGDKLPPERQLTQQFGASRVAVREALRTLELRGLVEVRQGAAGGYFIRDLDARPVCRDLATLLRLGRLTRAHIHEARLAIEPELARLAAQRASEADLKTLRSALDEAETPSACSPRVADGAVHRAIAEAAHTPVLALLAHALSGIDVETQPPTIDDAERIASEMAHRELVAAISAHQPGLAHDAMVAHLTREFERSTARAGALPEAG
jgi:GntR family transcriptional regulator, transcriptional repressor for pyruvate dehydrogenase complex